MTAPVPPVLREARPDDAPRLTELVRTSQAYGGAYRTMVMRQTIDHGYLQRARTRVGTDGGRIIGFYSLTANDWLDDARSVELDFMFVSDAQQGRGTGRLLFEDMRRVEPMPATDRCSSSRTRRPRSSIGAWVR